MGPSRCARGQVPSALLLPLLVLALGCFADAPRDREGPTAVEHASDRLHAVLVNGGGQRQINYHSHLEHLQSLLKLLRAAGVEPARITVFSSDGADPAEDLATRVGNLPVDFWLLPRRVGRALRPPVEYVDSRIEGFALRPATRDQLRSWFKKEGSQLSPGDTLLFYVTDHGTRNGDDPTNNTITLWGEKLSVGEFRELLVLLGPGVRVIMVMSQCYSGGFAHAIFPEGAESLPLGNVCGYFSATADRKAHGCYPEVSGRDAIGHSHHLFAALAAGHRLPDAQREVLVTDGTPDVPNTSSNFFLEQRLRRDADRAGRDLSAFVDALLAEALRDPLAWEGQIRLLDRVGHTFGFASPRSLAELEEQAEGLSELSERLATYAKLWGRALDDLRQENLTAFRAVHPEWSTRLELPALKALEPEARRRETEQLLDALVEFLEAAPERAARLENLRWKTREAKAARYRAEVRLGVVLRMRALLTEIAGRQHVARHAGESERRAFARLEACEDLTLARLPELALAQESHSPTLFPTLAQERRRLEAIVPGWLGIRYRSPRPGECKRPDLPKGAVVVSAVLPDSPALEAGLQVADVLLGPPGAPFAERHAVREWTMHGKIGAARRLRLLRNADELEVTIRLAAYPLELPKAPGPPEVGEVAPALDLELLGDARPPSPERSRLLLFWASWCSFCKRALPEVLAFSKKRGIPVVAITDEGEEEIAAFAREHPGLLPRFVATDRQRVHFQRYGVSGTPTFVLVDERGIVRHYQTGYNVAQGIRIDGWRWEGRPVRD